MQRHPAVSSLMAIFCLIFFGGFAAHGAGAAARRAAKSTAKSAHATRSSSHAAARGRAASRTAAGKPSRKPSSKESAARATATKSAVRRAPAAKTGSRRKFFAPYDPTKGDIADADDPVVRQVAIDALGHEKGSVLAVDPASGRILTIVGQKMAFSAGFEPCSTIKPFVALAGLQEGVITRETMLPVAYRRYMNLTEAMAHSNNKFFEQVGTRLGFDRVIRYDALLGLGQRVGYDIPQEQPGSLPPSPPIFGGVARMSSFGQGIRVTPFQLASLVSLLANGGTQYYLQYPRTEDDVDHFQPRVRQQLDIGPLLPDLRQGMLAAVLYGTAKRSYDPYGEQALGKTGTCNDESLGGRLGWFASYADQDDPKIVIVVLLHGGARIISGPHASEIAGRIYRGLSVRNYFADKDVDPRREPAPIRASAAGDRVAGEPPVSERRSE